VKAPVGIGTGGSTGSGGGKRNKGREGDGGSERREIRWGGQETKPRQAYPKILLSSIDKDPLNLDRSLDLSDRHPPVYQRAEDTIVGYIG